MGNTIKHALSLVTRSLLAAILPALMAAAMAACSALEPLPGGLPQTILSGTPTISAADQTTATSENDASIFPDATSTSAVNPIEISKEPSGTLPAAETPQPEDSITTYDFGIADLALIRPGQLSRHTSPIRVIANLDTTVPMETDITLYGEDGRILASKTLWSKPYNDPVNGNLITDIEFSIPIVAETGRLELKVYDALDRVWALNSVYLILLSRGITDRNYAPETGERILLQLPFPDQREISSSPIFISGMVRTQSDIPLTVWLIDETGTTVGEGLASVVLTPGSPYGQFVGEIPYQVSGPTQVLMTFGIQEGRIPGFTYIKTIEFTLLQDDS